MILVNVLSGAAVILGIYIIAVHVIMHTPAVSQTQGYHLGCFLIDSHTFNASGEVRAQLGQIQQEMNQKIKIGLHNSKVMGQEFDIKAMQLSKKFDRYIDALIASKLKQNSEIQFFRALRHASKDFDDCRKGITLNQTECRTNWISFEACQGRLKSLKDNLSQLMNKKRNTLDKVNSLLDYNYQTDFKKNKTNQVDAKYQSLMVQMQQKQREQQEQQATLKQVLESEKYYMNTLKNDLSHIKASYFDCKEHRQQYRRCEEITNEVQLLGYGSIETLQKRIDQKGSTLSQLKMMLDKSDNSASYKSLQDLWKKGILQYKGLLKLFIETKAKINLKCGCSEQKQIELQKEYQKVSLLVEDKSREIFRIQSQISQVKRKLQSLKDEKEKLWSKYQMEVADLANIDSNKIDTQGILLKNKIEIQRLHSEVSSTQRQIHSLQFQCNQYKNSMSRRLKDIDSVNTCLYKKEYYTNMKRLGSMNSRAKESDAQKAIRNELKQFLGSYGEVASIDSAETAHSVQELQFQNESQRQSSIKVHVQSTEISGNTGL